MLKSSLGAFFALLFWIAAARTMPAKDIGLATAAISAAALIVGLSKLGLDAGLVRYLPESKNKNGLYSTIVMVTLVLALVLTAVFMLGINIFSPALSFLREGWFLPVLFAYIAVTSIYSVQNLAFISIRRADLSLIQNLLLGARIPILLQVWAYSGSFHRRGIIQRHIRDGDRAHHTGKGGHGIKSLFKHQTDYV